MSLIARFDGRKAPELTARCAEKAERAGFVNVQTHYEPPSDTHTVTGTLPDTVALRTVDKLLGR